MPAALFYMPLIQFVDANGNPVPLGKVFSYVGGTTTPLSLFQDAAGTIPHANPAILDGGGRLLAYGTMGTAYRLNLLDANNVQVPGWPIDNILVTPNASPNNIAPTFTNTTAMQATMNPGEVGSEVIPASHTEEHQQLHYILAETKRTAQWYTTFRTKRAFAAPVSQAVENTVWTATGTTSWNFKLVIPDDWDGVSLPSLFLFRRHTAAGGLAKMFWHYDRIRDGVAIASSGNAAIDFTQVDLFPHLVQLQVVGVTLAAGDVIVIAVTRTGDDGADTNTGTVVTDGWYFQYTGYA